MDNEKEPIIIPVDPVSGGGLTIPVRENEKPHTDPAFGEPVSEEPDDDPAKAG